MIQLLTSYFFEEPKHINSFYVRKKDATDQFWTTAHVVGKRMADVELYVLTSSRTFSAAEEFTYNLKAMKRATIVGETTGGGAHPVDYVQSDDLKIGMSVPFGRAVNPITGTNWEGTGVEPDVKTTAEAAFDKAYLLALERAQSKSEGPRKEELKWVLEYRKALTEPLALPEEKLRDYVGRYALRTISLEDGKLFYQRDGRPKGALYAVADDRFALEEAEFFRLQFERNSAGEIIAVRGLYLGGNGDRSEREPRQK